MKNLDAFVLGMEAGGILAWRIGGPIAMLALIAFVPPRPTVVAAFAILLIGTLTAFAMTLPKLPGWRR